MSPVSIPDLCVVNNGSKFSPVKLVPLLVGANYVALKWASKCEMRSQPGQFVLIWRQIWLLKMQEIAVPGS